MKRSFLFFIVATCLVFNSLAQTVAPKKNSPKEDFKVNREYDEEGNLIRFDSTYTYSWSGDTTFHKSLSFKDFDNLFEDNFSFFNDSAFAGHSFFDDFFDFRENKSDSISSKFQRHPLLHSQLESLDEMMKMLQQQMLEMEEYQRKFFKEQPKWKEF